MKILHIGDIHLGSKLHDQSRVAEFRKVFQFITEFVKQEGVEAVLIAGDVFDTGTPSSESESLYFNFLNDLCHAGVKQLVIIAGNHDSPAQLNAPKAPLQNLGIHIIAQASRDDLSQEVIALGAPESPAAYVCAVPYLRLCDVREAPVQEGESGQSRTDAFRSGVQSHYRKVYELAAQMRQSPEIPIIGMGHLYAQGSTLDSSEKAPDLVGNLEGVAADQLPQEFAYMALGHIHRAQCVGGKENWRYAGSLLPMTFREGEEYASQVVLLDTASLNSPRIITIPRDCFRKMLCLRGTIEELQAQLQALKASPQDEEIWLKAICTKKPELSGWSTPLQLDLQGTNLKLLETQLQESTAQTHTTEDAEECITLSELTPEQLFLRQLKQDYPEMSEESIAEYRALFLASLNAVEDPSQLREDTTEKCAGRMQFKRLLIRNVNSLYGTHVIDFQDPAFRNGLFLISGNTGSGKSSILDAICLALYGATPRVPKITNDKNDVFSTNTTEKELLAELTFALGEKEYRASFRHVRKKRAKGFLPFEHKLIEDGTELPLKREETRQKIQELLGMDLSEFTRCVLLAQGGFDAFLKSDAKSRVEMLKKITGTERYSAIGRKINDDFHTIDDKMKALNEKLRGMIPLTEEQLTQLKTEQTQAQDTLKQLNDTRAGIAKQQQLFTSYHDEQERLVTAQKDYDFCNAAWEDAAPRRAKRDAAQRAQRCQESYDQWLNKSTELQKDTRSLQQYQDALARLAEALPKAQSKVEAALKAQADFKKEQECKRKLYQEVRQLDSDIAKEAATLAQAERDEQSLQKRLDQCRKDFTQKQKAWDTKNAQAETARQYLAGHPNDASLANRRGEWETRRLALVKLEAECNSHATELKDAEQSLADLETQLSACQEQLTVQTEHLVEQQQALKQCQQQRAELLGTRTEEELQKAKDAAGKLEDFFQSGAKREAFLSPNTPCPLCGSTSHPYCEGTRPPEERVINSLYHELDAQLKTIKKLNDAIHKGELTLTKTDGELKNLQTKQESLAKQRETALTRRNRLTQDWEDKQDEATQNATALANELHDALQLDWLNHSALPTELAQRITKYQNAQNTVDSLKDAQVQFSTDEATFKANEQSLTEQIATQKTKTAECRATLATSKKTRYEKLGEQDVETQEKQLDDEAKQKQSELSSAQTALTATQTQQREIEKLRNKLRENIDTETPVRNELHAQLQAHLRENAFDDNDAFLAVRMKPEDLQALERTLNQIENALAQAKHALEEQQTRIDTAKKALPDDVTADALEVHDAQLKSEQEAQQKILSDLTAKINNDNTLRKEQQNTLDAREKLLPQYDKRKFLDDHFGTSDSRDYFGKLAQEYTFQELLHYANLKRPASLRRHYDLIMNPQPDAKDSLELWVIDHCKEDIARSANNLSGGERFEVSLALALGLAEMSAKSKQVSLGNVLLDEGFGTLDQNELDNALDLLTSINTDDGKLVGIISHVEKLRERISTVIAVSNTNGIGTISGPGVCNIQDPQ